MRLRLAIRKVILDSKTSPRVVRRNWIKMDKNLDRMDSPDIKRQHYQERQWLERLHKIPTQLQNWLIWQGIIHKHCLRNLMLTNLSGKFITKLHFFPFDHLTSPRHQPPFPHAESQLHSNFTLKFTLTQFLDSQESTVRSIVAESRDLDPLAVMKIWIDFEKTMMMSPVEILFDQWCEINLLQLHHLVAHRYQLTAREQTVTAQQIAMENHASKLM